MQCFNSLPTGVPVSTRLPVNTAMKCLTRASSHPEHFTYRRPPSLLPEPSLRKGWILKPNHGGPDRALEVLLEQENFPSQNQYNAENELLLKNAVFRNYLRLNGHLLGVSKNVGEQSSFTKPKYVKGPDIDKKSFIRVYYLSALRIPAQESWELECELRGSLLNWPRVSNIARVPGDDVDEHLANLLTKSKERNVNVTAHSVRKAVYGDSKVFMTRLPKQNMSSATKEKAQRIVATSVEVVEDGSKPEQKHNPAVASIEDRLGLSEKRWKGSTRLLLLDEKHAGKSVSELPTELQAVHSRFIQQAASGLVICRLTLFYEYWSMDEVLRELLPPELHLPVMFERTGHVAELKLHHEHLPVRHLIAQVTLDKYKPQVRSVVVKRAVIHGKQYGVELELLAGSSSLVTTVWEHGNPFRVNMASVVWDSRLSSERQRLIAMFSENDVLCDVCAGVGLIAIPAGKKVRRVFANEVNPHAHAYLARNVVDNSVGSKVEVFNHDIQTFLSKVFYVERPLPITELVMSHPSAAADFLDSLVGAFSQRTWPNHALPRVHVYGIAGPIGPEEEFCMRIADILGTTTDGIHTTRLLEVALGKWIVYASFILPVHVGFQSTADKQHEGFYQTCRR